MERLAIYVNDAPYAQRFLEPLLDRESGHPLTLVMCPPKLSRRIGKWLSNRQRQQWQRGWADRLQQDIQALLPAGSAPRIEWTVAGGPLAETTAQLRRKLGTGLKVLDVRKPHLGQSLTAVDASATSPSDDRWKAPVAVTSSLSVVLALVD